MKISVTDYGDFATAGKAHVRVAKFEEHGSKSGDHVAHLEILAHSNPDDVGKIYKDYIPCPIRNGKAVFRIIEFMVGCGAITRQQVKDSQENDTDLEINPQGTVDRQMFIELVEEEYNGKTSIKVRGGRDYFRVDDPKCKDWPTNQGMLKRAKTQTAEVANAPATDSPF